MEEKIRHQLMIQKIKGMQKPTILMNKTDFENFKKDIESKVVNLKVGINPAYEGIPIKTSDFTERGNIVVYDDVLQFLH